MYEKILVLDFGGRFRDLAARKIRELKVYSEIHPYNVGIEKVKNSNPIGLVLTGDNNTTDEEAKKFYKEVLSLGVPVLDICAIGENKGIEANDYKEMKIKLDTDSPLFKGLSSEEVLLVNTKTNFAKLPEGSKSIASIEGNKTLASVNEDKNIFSISFHPEAKASVNGNKIFENFLYGICKASGDYTIDVFLERESEAIKNQVGDMEVLLALSGGVDSSVVAALLSQVIPGKVHSIFVDHGLLRKNEVDLVEKAFKDRDLKFIRVDAEDRFLSKLKGVTDPEQKRKIIGHEFIEVFKEEAAKLGKIDFLAQGTIYPDIIESGGGANKKIKSHHNVGGLPEEIGFEGIVEPLKTLFKDEVRILGKKLGLPDEIVERQPFPGPGLGVRVIGELTKEKLDILRDADAIYREEVDKLPTRPSQYFAALTNMQSVGVRDDERTYEYAVALRAVNTNDFMTATYAQIPHETLDRVSQRITSEVKGINRILFDITGKPPATIEWE
ncbi:MAG: glutamine-hydrolyzing GMP synthase [Tissierellia bacterium]|mgnify:CR=1 FL=1|nr:glutamine-hydrolyzing GMP synthase [Tissierellia bacterium]